MCLMEVFWKFLLLLVFFYDDLVVYVGLVIEYIILLN